MSTTPAPIHWEEAVWAALSKVEVTVDGDFVFDPREAGDAIERALEHLGFEVVRKERT